MNKNKLFGLISFALLFIGVGTLLGNSLSNGDSVNPIWVGIGLIIFGAVFFGMYLSSGKTNE